MKFMVPELFREEWVLSFLSTLWQPASKMAPNYPCLLVFTPLIFTSTLYQGWSVWPREYSRNDKRLKFPSWELTLSATFSDYWFGETSDHAVRKCKQPMERAHVIRNWCLQPTSRGTEEHRSRSIPSWPCSDCSLDWHFDCRVWETLGQRLAAKLLPDSWPTETTVIHAYFLKLLILGTACYTTTGN